LSTILSTAGQADKPTHDNGGFDAVAEVAEPLAQRKTSGIARVAIGFTLIRSFDSFCFELFNHAWGETK
jgi:hypothetical protein